MLTIKNLNKIYRTKENLIHALKDINLEFNMQGFIVITGKSGCGKSTLLNMIGGLDDFDNGEIIINGKSTKDFNWDSYRNTYVGFIFQEFFLLNQFTIGKNIAISLELQGISKDKITEKVKEVLKEVDLEDYENRLPNEISGGQKQRIAIARALIKSPEIILADEPTGNLDSETSEVILRTLDKLSKTKLVIMVTHDEEFARKYGDRIITLDNGVVVQDSINHKLSSNKEIIELNQDIYTIFNLPKGSQLTKQVIDYLNHQLIYSKEPIYLGISDDKEYKEEKISKIYVEEQPILTIDNKGKGITPLKKASLPFSYAYKLAIHSIFHKKLRLTFMMFLFVFTLILVGVASNLSFYNLPKTMVLSFEKADITEVPIRHKNKELCKKNSNGTSCGIEIVSLTSDEIKTIQEDFPGIESTTTYHEERLASLGIPDSENEYVTDVYKINVSSSNATKPELLIGDYPQDNEVLITDYLASIIRPILYPDIATETLLVGKTLSFNQKELKISGIVKTNYLKYDTIKTDMKKLDESNFYNDRYRYYENIFVTKNTFEYAFNIVTVFLRNEVYDYYRDAIITNKNNNNYLNISGRNLENDSEIVVTLSYLQKMIENSEELEPQDLIEQYLNQQLSYSFMDRVSYNQHYEYNKEYKIVGIINDLDKEIPFELMFSNNEYEWLYYREFTNAMVIFLSDNPSDNYKILQYIHGKPYEHQTSISYYLNRLDRTINKLRVGLDIFGVIIAVFSSILIYYFISISVNNKQKDIGILRAMGARGFDIAKIFISEGIILALTSSILAILGNTLVNYLINYGINDSYGVSIVIFYSSYLNTLFIIITAVLIVTLASYIPIKRISLMKPIKAIKNLE